MRDTNTISIYVINIWSGLLHIVVLGKMLKTLKFVSPCTIKQINQLDATISPVYYLTFIYSSTCFGRHHAHHQELNNCSSSLWFYLRSMVVAVLLFVVGPAGPTTTNILTINTVASCWIFYINYTIMYGSTNIKYLFILDNIRSCSNDTLLEQSIHTNCGNHTDITTSTFCTSSGVTLTSSIFYWLTRGASIPRPLSILPKLLHTGYGVLNT